MAPRIVVRTLCLSLALFGAVAQTPEPAKPADSTPPDIKAINEAGKITDPEKKIEAYQKVKKDFPDSVGASVADSRVLSTLVKKMPDQKARILKQARSNYRAAAAKDRGSEAFNIASEFLNANMLLKDAEGYARKGVQSMVLATYLQEQVAGFEKRKQKPPSGEELQKRFRENRARRVAVLGRIELKLGKNAQGQKLLEEVYSVTPDNGLVNAALGELAAKAGDDSKAMEFLIPARLSGKAPDTAIAAMDAIYRKRHNGSLDGLVAMLDGEYRKRFPNPVKVEGYKPTEKRSDRMVLAEVFTGSGCPPCAGADVAFDAAMERYKRTELAVVMYHVHVPEPDPMTNAQTVARSESYAVRGVPTFAIDGNKASGGGDRQYAKNVFDRFQKDIEKDLESPAEARLKVDASVTGNSVKVTAAVGDVKSESKDLKLQVALVEKEIRFNGENGIRFHPMVVRALGGEKGEGFKVDGAMASAFDETFDLEKVSQALKAHLDDYEARGHRGEPFQFAEKKYQIDRGDLAVVVFVQDEKTKHVLQAAYVDLAGGAANHTVTEANEPK
jgi:thiol-disulfide isomerase/thioredoxin